MISCNKKSQANIANANKTSKHTHIVFVCMYMNFQYEWDNNEWIAVFAIETLQRRARMRPQANATHTRCQRPNDRHNTRCTHMQRICISI